MSAEAVTLRAAEPGDAEALRELNAEPSNMRNTLQLPYPSIELWRRRLESQSELKTMLVAMRAGQMVGFAHLMPGGTMRTRHVADLGISVSERARRAGVGDLLLGTLLELGERWLNLSRIQLEVYHDNDGAIALYRKHRFEPEGLARRAGFRDGEYVDILHMARLREL